MLGHVRSLLFVDFRNVRMPTIADRLFYFLTSLGHDAVVVFFVLSGYFVGGSVAGLINKGRWSWQDYGIQRIVRLWTVLIPGLLLTAAWDELGLYNATARYYFPGAVSSQNAVVNQQLGIDALIGNVLFLQTILVPTYGSNGPLWSLANEFWYYVLFPLIALTLWTRSGITGRVTCLVMALIILVWLPTNIVAAFGIWILGYVAYEISISGKVPLIGSSRVVLLASSALLLGSLTLRRLAPLSV